MDADAVKYSLDRHMTLPGSFRRSELSSVDHVDVVDPLTVKMVLKAPSSPLLATLTDRSGMIVSKKAAEAALSNAKTDFDVAKAQSELAVMAAQLSAIRRFRGNAGH